MVHGETVVDLIPIFIYPGNLIRYRINTFKEWLIIMGFIEGRRSNSLKIMISLTYGCHHSIIYLFY